MSKRQDEAIQCAVELMSDIGRAVVRGHALREAYPELADLLMSEGFLKGLDALARSIDERLAVARKLIEM